MVNGKLGLNRARVKEFLNCLITDLTLQPENRMSRRPGGARRGR
jgi:hypothetical protein